MSLVLDFQVKPTSFGDTHSFEKISLRGCAEWVTDDVLEQLSTGCKIRSAALFRCWRLTDAGLISFLKRNGATLEFLELAGCTKITDSSLRAIGRFCPKLVHLDLTRCPLITDVGINSISAPRLEALLLYANSQLSESSYEAIFECVSLRKLDLCGHANLDSQRLIAILNSSGSTLEYLNLSWCVGLTDDVIDFIIQAGSLRNIKYLSLFGIKNLTKIDSLVEYLKAIPSLAQLDVRGITSAFPLTDGDCRELRRRIRGLTEWKLHH
jgi:F-box/leucine-rich repeat protein 2/20